ncbi:hypothetical protein [Paenibacillus larvae]|uniref:hypothetical protein n=1 Tax=Paenibacillus larvae TaxID=1464 RepID=UPI001F1BD05B|nr:hypothetical protein [Paenibacillus larvae]
MQKRKAAGVAETPEEAFERIGAMALTPKQRMQFDAALAAFRSGEIGSLRADGKRWTKGDVLAAGHGFCKSVRRPSEGNGYPKFLRPSRRISTSSRMIRSYLRLLSGFERSVNGR